MKKLLTLLLLFTLIFVSAKAQKYTPFPDSNAEWTVYYIGTCVTGGIPDTSITKYSLNGDTLINGTTFHKLSTVLLGGNMTGTFDFVTAIREENKVIYVYPGNALVDSTIYNFNYLESAPSTVIDSVDSVLAGSDYRRRYHINRPNSVEYIIEGIGSTNGLYSDFIPQPTCGFHEWQLICFKQNGIVKYLSPNFDNCESTKPKTITAIKTPGKYASLKIFPNPTLSKQFHIDNVDAYEGLSAKVTDYTGRVVLSQNLNRVNNIITLPNEVSMYVLMVINKQGQVVLSQKILNQ